VTSSKGNTITREDVQTIIENYRRHGRDTTELETFLAEAFAGRSKTEIASVDQLVAELRKKSPITQGTCSLCEAQGTLVSGVCDACFLPWAMQTAEAKIARMTKDKQREK
jgi:hypothetical protein